MARLRLTLFTILTIAILAVASYPIFQILPRAHAVNVNISLVASVNGWNYSLPSGKNPTITVRDIDDVYISLTSADTQQHQFYIDKDRNGLPDCITRDLCSRRFNSTSPLNYGWASGVIGPGTYNYYDSYNQAATNGTLIVKPGPFPPTANISLIASVNGWNYSQPSGNNPTITVRVEQNVNINLNSADPPGVNHRFYLDVDKNGIPDCSLQDMCSGTFDSTVSSGIYWAHGNVAPGTYKYYDWYNQIKANGTFIILPATPDYTISASPTTLTIIQGNSQTSTITITSQNNFTGTVSLAANSIGVTTALNPTSVSPPKNGVATSTLNVTAPLSTAPGAYLVGITATNGTIQHNTIVNVQVVAPDFGITTNTNTLSIIQGSSGAATITITSQNSFSGKVSLKEQITPNGPTPSLNPITVNIPSGGSQSSTLTVSTTPTTPPGNYTITITGNATSTSGQLAHSLTITLRVSPPPTTSPGSPVLSTFLFGALAAAILIITVVALLARRISK